MPYSKLYGYLAILTISLSISFFEEVHASIPGAAQVIYPMIGGSQDNTIAFETFESSDNCLFCESIPGNIISAIDIPATMTSAECDAFTYLAACQDQAQTQGCCSNDGQVIADNTQTDSSGNEGPRSDTEVAQDGQGLAAASTTQESSCGELYQCTAPTTCDQSCYNPCEYTAALGGGGGGGGGFGSGGGGSAGAFGGGGGGGGGGAALAAASSDSNSNSNQNQNQNQDQNQDNPPSPPPPPPHLPEPSTWVILSTMLGVVAVVKRKRDLAKKAKELSDK